MLNAWFVPALLTTYSFSTREDVLIAVVAALSSAGCVAFFPRGWKAACILTILALPFTLWWCGAAAVGGAGPDFETAIAAFNTTVEEAYGAANFVARLPEFWATISFHLTYLGAACFYAFKKTSNTYEAQRSNGFFLIFLLPLVLGACAGRKELEVAGIATPLVGCAKIAIKAIKSEKESQVTGGIELKGVVMASHKYVRQKAEHTVNVDKAVLAVFIIGESVRADAMGPQTANRGPWSKALNDRINAGLGVWLPKTCASSNLTLNSVPMLLTMTDALHRGDQIVKPTVLGVLKEAGFKTGWFANNSGGWEAAERGHDVYAGSVNVDPDNSFATQTNISKFFLDDGLIQPAKEFADANAGNPRAEIIHMIGSHAHYVNNYPANAFAAQPTNLSSNELLELQYQRATEYGTKNILEMSNILDESRDPAFLVFTSDHGENLPSDNNGALMHGNRVTQQDGHVAAFILWNKAFVETHRTDLIKPLLSAPEIAHIDVAKIFLALAGISDNPIEPSKPIIWATLGSGAPWRAITCSDIAT